MTRKTVWILGAGFSRPLGGPLLGDLLAEKLGPVLASQLRALAGSQWKYRDPFPNEITFGPPFADASQQTLFGTSLNSIVDLCRAFQSHLRGKPDSPGFWSDAEEFLDQLDSAVLSEKEGKSAGNSVEAGCIAQIKQALPKVDLSYWGRAARKAIAFDCSIFLQGANPRSEKWQPYWDWARKLDENHTIITFNYDLIPERLEEIPQSGLLVHSPSCGFDHCIECGDARTGKKALVFKVHGSVNWWMAVGKESEDKEAEVKVMPHPSDFILDAGTHEIAIGIPGPQKKQMATKTLGTLWRQAMERIKTADTIIFAGYRFPPTDALARRDILTAIRDNERHDLKVLTVLGPNNPDENRLARMIEIAFIPPEKRAGKERKLLSMPLYIQDYLSLLQMVGPNSIIPGGL